MSSLAIRLRHAFGAASIDVTLDLPGQDVTAIFGPSGAGKSVLIQALAGHSNLSTTQRYIESHAEAQRKIVELA